MLRPSALIVPTTRWQVAFVPAPECVAVAAVERSIAYDDGFACTHEVAASLRRAESPFPLEAA